MRHETISWDVLTKALQKLRACHYAMLEVRELRASGLTTEQAWCELAGRASGVPVGHKGHGGYAYAGHRRMAWVCRQLEYKIFLPKSYRDEISAVSHASEQGPERWVSLWPIVVLGLKAVVKHTGFLCGRLSYSGKAVVTHRLRAE